MHTGKVALLSSPRCQGLLRSASQPCRQDEQCILCDHDSSSAHTPMPQDLSGALGSLSGMKLLKERRELQHFQTLFRATTFLYCTVMRVGMGLPRLPGAKSGEKREVAPKCFFCCLSVLPPLSAACLRCGFNGALSSVKQELPGI